MKAPDRLPGGLHTSEAPERLPGGLRLFTTLAAMATEYPRYGEMLLADFELEIEEELWVDDTETDHDGWFCVATAPFPCPAEGCTFIAEFMTAAHLILVWEERDDPNLLRHAERAKQVGRNPHVTDYESSFGPSASYYAWEAAGRPVHGVRK
jgi:hypothetical protein